MALNVDLLTSTLFRNTHSHDEHSWRVSFKSLHKVWRYRIA